MRLLVFFIFSTVISFAQKTYNDGYIITNDGERINAFIKKIAIDKKPENILYKLNKKDEKVFSISPLEIKEIAPHGRNRYIIATVQMDNTSSDLQKLNGGDIPSDNIFRMEEETVYLEILTAGKASLYRSYLDKIEKIFYKSEDNQTVRQLLYKKFFRPRPAFYAGPDYAIENNEYHKQLYTDVPCFNKSKRIFYPKFSKLSLIKYFRKYNKGKCK